jgi:hypothetical protein
MNTQTNFGLSFNYDEPTDKPMMKALLKLRNMGLIEIEWESGDIRYTSENPFSVKKHLNVKITDPTVELDFPKVDEPLAWTGYDRTPFHSDFHSLWAPPSLWASPLPRALHHWSNVCPHCIQQGIWGHIHYHVHLNDVDTDTVCFVGCQECVKKNQWTWGKIKINDTHNDLPCNGAHSPIDYPVVVPVSERIGEWWRELSDGRWTGHGCWGQENMNRELVRSTLSQVVLDPTWSFTQDDQIIYQLPSWNSVFDQVPQRIIDLILRTTGMYMDESPGSIEIKPGQPDEVCMRLETNYCDQIPKSDDLESEEAAEHIRNIYHTNGIDTLPLDEYDEYDEDDHPELDSEADTKRKESVSKGFSLLEEAMSEGKLNEGKYLELCNVFRDIHQN